MSKIHESDAMTPAFLVIVTKIFHLRFNPLTQLAFKNINSVRLLNIGVSMKTLISFFTILSLCFTAHARTQESQGDKVTSLLYVCGMTFKVSGKSASIILGYTYLKGEGELSCYDVITGAKQKIATKVKIKGPAVGLSYQSVEISAKVAGIGLSRGPESLLGRYLAVRESVAVGVGVGLTKSLRVAKDAFVLNLSVQGVKGIGAQIDILSLDIQPRDEEDLEQWNNYSSIEAPSMKVTSVEVARVRENQPIQIVDADGNVLKTISIKLNRSNDNN